MKKMVEVEIKSPLEEINKFLENKNSIKLFSKGWELREKDDDIPPIETLEGIAKINNGLFLVDKALVGIYARGEVKTDYIVAFPLKYIKLAIELGLDTLYVFQKDYPCVCKKDSVDEIMVIAPKVNRGNE
jgi:hypothetical protein